MTNTEEMMDFARIFKPKTSVISVEMLPDGTCGPIRVEAANEAAIKLAEAAFDENSAQSVRKFVPGSNYENYMKKELNFENFCYQCAVLKKPIHAYIRPEHFDFWIDQIMLPLNIQDGNKFYCSYTQEISNEVNVDTLTNLSAEISSNVLKTCIKLRGTNNFRKTINEIIEDIRNLCDASTCAILLTDFKEHTCSVLGNSKKEGSKVRPIPEIYTNDFIDYAAKWIRILDGSNCLIIKDGVDLEIVRERDPNWYVSLTEANVDSLVLLPLLHNEEIIGFMWVTNFDVSKVLQIKETLELTTFFIASEVSNYLMLERLEVLSNMDLLTGVRNRNAMNNRVSQLVSGKESVSKFGVVFADLNGLKPLNDKFGHDAGDKLLKDAANRLKAVFDGCEIYRAGGDEFMVFAPEVDHEFLETRIEMLRKESEDPEKISFALGFSYDSEGGDVRKAMRAADGDMYEDKKRFYEMFPELKVR